MIKYLLTYIVIASTLIYAKVNESFTLNHSDNSSFSIQFDIENIELEEKGEYTRINTNTKGETSIIGMPKLPQFSTLLKLDPQ